MSPAGARKPRGAAARNRRVVLITGAAHFLGLSVAGQLTRLPDVERVVAVDTVLPDVAGRARLGDAVFERIDIRTPAIGRVMAQYRVDTVVHAAASADPLTAAARTSAAEVDVLGTMQLLAACQRTPSLRHLIVRSSVAVYGASPRDAAVATEEMAAHQITGGAAQGAVDVEDHVRGFARRRPDVRVCLPRLAEIIGPTVHTPITRYFSLAPLVPTPAGQDARVQFLYESDAVDALVALVFADADGPVNIAGRGSLTVLQALHRAGRMAVPVPGGALDAVGRLLALARVQGFSVPQVRSLFHDRVVDTTRWERDFGLPLRHTTGQAFDAFAASLPAQDWMPRTAEALERRARRLISAPPPAERPGGATARRRRHLVAVAEPAPPTPARIRS